MAFFERIADILKANINDMIDKAEDPVKMVKQLILEMEEQVDEATRALGQAMGSQKVAAKELADAKAKVADWNDKAKLALKNGDEALARKALDIKVGLEGQVDQLQGSYDGITAQVDKLKDQVQTLKMKLDEARARQNVLIARAKMAEAATNVATSISSATTESAFAKLDKLEQKIVQQEATAEAFTELHGGTAEQASVADEFEQLQHKDAVDSELERLKGELGLA